ncbi:MAG: suppressor of fused domain protein [Deltaproteobacteria bacterium]|nr:suppressor of fused domain protein [Deltaproteobacteria bacterium]
MSMLDDPKLAWLLADWELEIRSGHTPVAELFEEIPERYNEHFLFEQFPEDAEEKVLSELRERTEQLIAREKAEEATWLEPTANDRLAAAFQELGRRGVLGQAFAGLTIQDGWSIATLEAKPDHRGVVFFHQEDVLDALLSDEEFLLAFGAFEADPAMFDSASAELGRVAAEVLQSFGFRVTWSGSPRERLRLEPFEWRNRRWTSSPNVSPGGQRSLPLGWLFKRSLGGKAQFEDEMQKIDAGRIQEHGQEVVAFRTTNGFHSRLSSIMRNVWKELGGRRGQVGHLGLPHTFVPAGKLTVMGARSAYSNLTLDELKPIWDRVAAVRGAKEKASAGDEPASEEDGTPEAARRDEAIEHALALAYPGVEPFWFGIPEAGRAEFPLRGFLALRIVQPEPHWLIVSRGLSDLERRVELTCRLRAPTDEQNYGWVAHWMQGVADSLASQHSYLEPFHHKQMVDRAGEDELLSVVFVEDVVLRPSSTPFGELSFLQMVGLTPQEYSSVKDWSSSKFVALMRQRDQLLMSDPRRQSYMREADFASEVRAGIDRDGSSTGVLFGVGVLWFKRSGGLEVHLSVDAVDEVRWALLHRLRFGMGMILIGASRARQEKPMFIVLDPETGASTAGERDGVQEAVLRIPPHAAAQVEAALSSARPGPLAIPELSGVRLLVVAKEEFQDPRYPWSTTLQ